MCEMVFVRQKVLLWEQPPTPLLIIYPVCLCESCEDINSLQYLLPCSCQVTRDFLHRQTVGMHKKGRGWFVEVNSLGRGCCTEHHVYIHLIVCRIHFLLTPTPIAPTPIAGSLSARMARYINYTCLSMKIPAVLSGILFFPSTRGGHQKIDVLLVHQHYKAW